MDLKERLSEVGKGLVTFGVTIGLVAVIGTGMIGGLNLYKHHDVDYKTKDSRVMSEVDGITSHTQIELSDGCVEVSKKDSFFPFTDSEYVFSYNDGGILGDFVIDGKVDCIYLGNDFFAGNPSIEFYVRSNDYDKFPELFDKADKEVEKQLKRFGVYGDIFGEK